MNRVTALLISSWFGIHIMGGYIVAPILFKNLQITQAANIAGTLFTVSSYVGLFAWILAFWQIRQTHNHLMYRPKKRLDLWLSALLVLSIGINQFLITPVIEAFKSGTTNWLMELMNHSFGVWHGISQTIYLITTILGIILLLRLLRINSDC